MTQHDSEHSHHPSTFWLSLLESAEVSISQIVITASEEMLRMGQEALNWLEEFWQPDLWEEARLSQTDPERTSDESDDQEASRYLWAYLEGQPFFEPLRLPIEEPSQEEWQAMDGEARRLYQILMQMEEPTEAFQPQPRDSGIHPPPRRGIIWRSPEEFLGAYSQAEMGFVNCRYHAHSPYLLCTVNPAGPCQSCPHFQPEEETPF
ncbi:MAG: DUF6464 family protein [Cyanobacteriota bacterium]|nr:DUF6464 family protein [Cyanobacteriota bacterium]